MSPLFWIALGVILLCIAAIAVILFKADKSDPTHGLGVKPYEHQDAEHQGPWGSKEMRGLDDSNKGD